MIQEIKNKVEGNIEVEESLTPFMVKLESMPQKKDLKHYNYDSFDGLGDPEEHINYFEQITLIYYYNDLTRCRLFTSILKGGAQKWFIKIPYRQLLETIQGTVPQKISG